MSETKDYYKILRLLLTKRTSPARRQVVEALVAGLEGADPRILMRKHVHVKNNGLRVDSRLFDMSRFDRVLVLGGGKASGLMAVEMEKILGRRIADGLVSIPDYLTSPPKTKLVRFHKATHPLPTTSGVKGVKMMLEMTRNLSKRDLVVCLLSGGGSALMPLPTSGLSIGDKMVVTDLLLNSGAKIEEVNAVRKHLSGIKGGRLAEKLYPATVITLIISDVVSDRLDSIASGPLTPDRTTFAEAKLILKRYELWNRIPESARKIIERGSHRLLPETPKPGSRAFERVHSFIVGSNRDSCMAAARCLRKSGHKTLVLSTRLEGEARHVGTVIGSVLRDRSSLSRHRPFALVAGGETTVTVKGDGLGGRNQELVLSAGLGIRGQRGCAVGSIDTDGVDGPTRAAGALADGNTVQLAIRKGLEPESFLKKNDSYHFFNKLDSLIITGPTGTNVGDLSVAIATNRSLT